MDTALNVCGVERKHWSSLLQKLTVARLVKNKKLFMNCVMYVIMFNKPVPRIGQTRNNTEWSISWIVGSPSFSQNFPLVIEAQCWSQCLRQSGNGPYQISRKPLFFKSTYIITFRVMKSYMGRRGISPRILNLNRDVVVSSTSRHGRFTPGKTAPLSHWLLVENSVSPISGLDLLSKRNIHCLLWDSNPGLPRP
jgi:hypothetical protein